MQSVGYSTAFPATLLIQAAQDRIQRADVADLGGETTGGTEFVSPRFFDTVGIERMAGRDFTWQDDSSSTPVVILNSILADRLFPDGGAIGRHVRVGRDASAPALEVVGIVADAPVFGIRVLHVPVAFRPMLQNPRGALVPIAIVRASGRVDAVALGFTRVLGAARFHFLRDVDSLEDVVDQAVLRERLGAWGASSFAGLALLLSALGVYGLVAYTATRRTREIGVRMALGARPRSILMMVVRQGLAPACAGVAIGVVGAAGAGRLTRSMLYGVAPYDAAAIGCAAALLMSIGILAAAIPAYRASTIDPMRALRED